MTWYRIKYGKIEPVEIVRETKAFVVIKDKFWNKEIRTAKRGGWHESYYPTFQKAKLALIEKCSRDVVSLTSQLIEAKESLAKINALEEPK
jgi:hypothetical protein